MSLIQNGEDAEDGLSLKVIFRNFKVIFRKRALQSAALVQKITCNLRHPMSLRHPVQPVPDKMRHEMVIGMQVAILDGQSPGLLTNEPFEKRPVMP